LNSVLVGPVPALGGGALNQKKFRKKTGRTGKQP